jgi:hypothetical protein
MDEPPALDAPERPNTLFSTYLTQEVIMNGRRHSVLWPVPAIAAAFFSTGAQADNFGEVRY